MRPIIIALVVILIFPNLAVAQVAEAVPTGPDQGIDSRTCTTYTNGLAIGHWLVDDAVRLAVAAARDQEPQSPKPQKKLRSVAFVVAGIATAAATGWLTYWMVTCKESRDSISHCPTSEALKVPYFMGAAAGAMIWYGARGVEEPAASIAFRVRF